MALRTSPTNKREKEKLRQSKVREEQDRIIRIIKRWKEHYMVFYKNYISRLISANHKRVIPIVH